jgi:hypothetical protein
VAAALHEGHGVLQNPELLAAVRASAQRTLTLLNSEEAATEPPAEEPPVPLPLPPPLPPPPPSTAPHGAGAIAEHVSVLERMTTALTAQLDQQQQDAPLPMPSMLPQVSSGTTVAVAAGECPLEAAVEELIERRKNKYVQKKSNTAWRLEPHLPRDIAGDVADAIGKTRLAGYGLLTTPVKGGIFREFLVCSTHERWWSCVDNGLRMQCAPMCSRCWCHPGHY